ncbi:MAG: putative Ig domain-containing protein, partial [Cytophagales bacterium]|nr:putative Ig domain-containing protein [Cytophagales bacterium]
MKTSTCPAPAPACHRPHPQHPKRVPMPATPNAWRTGWLTLCLLLLSLPLALAQDVLLGLTANGGQEGRGTAFSIKSDGTGFALLKRFADWGKKPTGDLTLGRDGYFYGMTSLGGTYNGGTLFRVTPGGDLTVLHHFVPTTDGSAPAGSLVQATDGNFYGMTSAAGQANSGTIFRITPAGIFTVLRHLTRATDGGTPAGNLTMGNDGLLYGMTNTGGANGFGTLFRISTGGAFAVQRSFAAATDGRNPYGSLTKSPDGSFYGMNYGGGLYNQGTVFKYVPGGSFTVLHNFRQSTDGCYPRGNLAFGNDGHLYGMTTIGGTSNQGTVFRLTLGKVYTVLKHFKTIADGGYPWGSLTKATDGSFYGMTTSSGSTTSGIIFRMTAAGGFTLMKPLTAATDGGNPTGNLVRGGDGNFYGMTSTGGNNLFGTIFRITPANGFTVLVHLNGATHGNAPQESLVQGGDNAFYGTTSTGGKFNYGTVFRICGGVTTVLKHFNRSLDGGVPKGSLVQGTDGNYYGTTSEGGTNSHGTIFRITPAGVYTVLRHLKSLTDGGFPEGSLARGADGNLYGVTRMGGTNGAGTIFQLNPATHAYTVLRHLVLATDGSQPSGGLLAAPDGFFYGMTSNRIFKINAAAHFVVVHTLLSSAAGNAPKGSLVRGSDGFFYGTTSAGSTYNLGSVFKMSAAGEVTVLRRFNGTTDGGRPSGTLVQGTDGAFYGTASEGGNFKAGTLFRVTSGGVFSVLRHLNLATDGGTPLGGFVIQKNPLVANGQSVSTTEDTPKALTLTGAGGSPLTYTIVTPPKHGKLGGTGNLRTYSPNADFEGNDSFTFVVSVGCLASAPATVNISVSAVNDAPVLAPIGNKSIAKGSLLTFTALATEVDAGQTKTFSLVNAPAGATIGASTGVLAWTPAATGTFSLTVKVTDNGSPILTDTETITVSVTSAARLAAEDGAGDQADVKISLHPNPAAHTLYVALETAAPVEGTAVVDASGRTHLLNG